MIPLSDTRVTATFLTLAAAGVFYWWWNSLFAAFNRQTGMMRIMGLPHFGSLQFASDPYGFLSRARAEYPSHWISFDFVGRRVVVPYGEASKKVIFHHKSFSFWHGYALFARSFNVLALAPNNPSHDTSGFILRSFTRTDVIDSYMRSFLKGIRTSITTWDEEGVLKPSEALFGLVFDIGLRIGFGDEVADHPSRHALALRSLLAIIENMHPQTAIIPYLPTPRNVRLWLSGYGIWRLVQEVKTIRTEQRSARQGILQSMIDEQADMHTTVTLSAMSTFAPVATTGPIFMWLNIYISQHPLWREKVLAEIGQFITDNIPADDNASDPLADIPLSIWESQLPVVDLCIAETIRLAGVATLARQNVGDDVVIEGHQIRTGDFVLMMVEEANWNEEYYDNPRFWQPDRDLSRAQTTPYSMLSFGHGNYACIGQRLAKCILKFCLVSLWSSYDLQLVDLDGQPFKGIPHSTREIFRVGEPIGDIRFKYRRRKLTKVATM